MGSQLLPTTASALPGQPPGVVGPGDTGQEWWQSHRCPRAQRAHVCWEHGGLWGTPPGAGTALGAVCSPPTAPGAQHALSTTALGWHRSRGHSSVPGAVPGVTQPHELHPSLFKTCTQWLSVCRVRVLEEGTTGNFPGLGILVG